MIIFHYQYQDIIFDRFYYLYQVLHAPLKVVVCVNIMFIMLKKIPVQVKIISFATPIVFFPKLNCQFSKIKLPVLIYWTHSYNHHSYLVCVFYYIWNIIIVQWCELTLNWLSTYTLYFGNFSTVYYIPQYHAMKGNTFILWCIYIYIYI